LGLEGHQGAPMQSTRVRAGWRSAGLVLGLLLGTACLLRSGATGWIHGAISPASASRAAPAMAEKGGQLQKQQYKEGETNLWGQPLAEDTKANFAKADQARKEFDMRNNVDTWRGPMAEEEEGPTGEVYKRTSSAYGSRAAMYGAQDDMLAKAAQLRADYMARNGQTEWLDVQQNERVENMAGGLSPIGAGSALGAAKDAPAASAAAPQLTANQQAAYPK